ncbi:MAG: hypothetical protein ACHQIL_12900 [Steroidobacterales bacterium]
MDHAIQGGWCPEARPGFDILISLRELNRRFLGLVAAAGRETPLARIAALSAAQQAAAANCPYALFDVRFDDERYWLPRLQATSAWVIADAPPVDTATLEFVRLALFYVWHITTTAPLRAQLLLGMPRDVVAAFAMQTVDRLPGIAVIEARNLTARWHSCDAYWKALIDAAAAPSALQLRRAQLRGIQFAAAARLPQG